MAEQNVPLPPKRTKFIIVAENEWKEALVASFKGFSANQVSQEHVQKAEACIRQGGTRDERYRLVPFERILQENQQHGKPNYLTSMTSAYDLLLKFVINLLKPNRPAVWRSIKTDNTSFKARVACMRGYDDILRTAGYTEKGENILQFPDTVQEPNKDKLYVIAAELLMARLEVDQMNSATQQPGRREGERSPQQNRGQTATQHGTDGSPGQNRAQTAFISRNDARGSQGGQGQQYYQGSRDRPDGRDFRTSGSTTMAYDGGTGGETLRNEQQRMDQSKYQPTPQRHDPHLAESLQGGHRQPVGMSRNQFDENRVMSSSNEERPVGGGAFTVNLGSPSELAKQSRTKQRPVPKPRVRSGKINTSDRSANHHGRVSPQSSLPSPSSSASSLYSPTTLSDSDEGSLGGGGGPRKAVAFCEPNLSAIKEVQAGESDDIEDPYVKKLRERRLAAKRGDKKNVTVAASSTVSHGGGGIEQIRPRTTGHALRHDTDPQGHSPSLSEFRQSLSPGRMHRQRPTTPPGGRGHGQTTPPSGYSHVPHTTPSAWQEKPATPPIPKKWSDEQATPSGRSEETSDDSSSEKFSTPPTTISPIPDNREQEVTSPATPPAEGTKRSTSVASDTSEHDAALDTLRKRRLKLKEEREKSSEKPVDITPRMTETEITSETFPTSQAPTRLSGPESEIRSRPYDSSVQRENMVPQSTLPTLTPDGTGVYCPGCKCKVRLGQKKCQYCEKYLYPYNPTTAPTGNAGGSFELARPGANVPPAVGEGVDMSGYATPLEPRPQYPRDQYYHPDPNAPALPPKPAPKAEPYGKSDLFDALGNPIRAVAPEDTPSQQPPPARPREVWGEKNQIQPLDDIRHYDRSHLPAQRPPMAGSDVNPSGMSYALQGENGPEREPSQQPSAIGGASRPPLAHSTSGIEQIRYKLQKFREHLKKSKGLTDYQIDSDPDYIQMRESETHKYREEFGGEFNLDDRAIEPREHVPEKKGTSARRVDPRRFHKVDTMEMSFPAVSVRNFEAMEQLKEDGEELLTWIKRCVPFGYSLDEIQVASDFVREGQRTRSRNPLVFLDSDWAQMTRSVQDWVAGTQSDSRPFVGRPTEDETRKALVETSGDVKHAVDIIYKNRKNKIEALLKRFEDMRAICPTIDDLAWKSAVDVLCVNGMDVDKACYAVQCEWLQPLYDSINSEHKKLKQDEMKEIKEIISKKDDQFSKEARCRMLMAECDFDVQDRAQLVLGLMEQVDEGGNDYPLNYYVDAAHDFENLKEASDFLFKECPIQGFCAEDKIPIHEMITMPGCTCSLCKECFKGHFTVVIQEKQVKHFNCPLCGKPDMSNKDVDTQEMYELMFVSMIKQHLDSKTYELCQEKLKEFNLTKDPEFLWCADDRCGSGFIYEGDRMRPRGIQCPNCKHFMCWKCKKPWEAQHDGLTCERFTQWKLDNDPEAQELGLAAHLNDKGIECPACHAKYELARGGCMHFKCTKCPNEFCSGCGESMKKGKECGKYNSCATKGLHAHHPRDCLFFLRDFPVKTLQDFLKENKQEFDTEAPKEQIEAAKREKKEKKKKKKKENGDDDLEGEEGEDEEEEEEEEDEEEEAEAGGDDGVVELRCRVEEQKEDPDGLRDEICGRVAEEGHAGLCIIHYREYLVNIINKNGLDPVTIYELGQIKAMLMREEMEVPDQEDDEDEEQYRERLIEHVQARLNLTGGRKAGEAQAAEGAAAGDGEGEGDEGN